MPMRFWFGPLVVALAFPVGWGWFGGGAWLFLIPLGLWLMARRDLERNGY
jgi:hypothetical protein